MMRIHHGYSVVSKLIGCGCVLFVLAGCVSSGANPSGNASVGLAKTGEAVVNLLGVGGLTHTRVNDFKTWQGETELRKNLLSDQYEFAFIQKRKRALIPEIANASAVAGWNLKGRESVVVLRGESVDCPISYLLASIRSDNIAFTWAGSCRHELRFENDDNRSIRFELVGLDDPWVWNYADREVTGPVRKSVLMGAVSTTASDVAPSSVRDVPVVPRKVSTAPMVADDGKVTIKLDD